MAEDKFGDVENKNLPESDYSGEVVFTRDHSFGRIFKVVPGAHIR
jgi:hypothetical protein